MSATPSNQAILASAYQIEIEGRIDSSWSEWLGGELRGGHPLPGGQARTVLQVHLEDQAALRGLLNRLWDLNLVVISVRRVDSAEKLRNKRRNKHEWK